VFDAGKERKKIKNIFAKHADFYYNYDCGQRVSRDVFQTYISRGAVR
jgi:hypothetical protein